MGTVRRTRAGDKPPAIRPVETCMIVMVCTDMSEADQVGKQLSELNKGCLVAYRKVEDLIANAPSGKVALIILATNDNAEVTARMLKWLRHQWPRCPLTVVGDGGCGEQEMAAREGGACYLARPIAPEQWAAMLSHVLGGHKEVVRDKAVGVPPKSAV